MPAAVAFDLKGTIKQKVNYCILKVAKMDVVIPARSTVSAEVKLPPNITWLMVMDVHDVPKNVFTHTCVKDGYVAFKDLPIDGSTMTLLYTIPFMLERHVRGEFKNTTDTDEEFKLAIYYAEVPIEYVKRLKRNIEFEDEVAELAREIWAKLSPEEKRARIGTWMKKSPETFAAMLR